MSGGGGSREWWTPARWRHWLLAGWPVFGWWCSCLPEIFNWQVQSPSAAAARLVLLPRAWPCPMPCPAPRLRLP